jgi:hypothetical protein
MSAYDRAVGGALKLKGVGPLITKKESSGKKKEKKRAAAAAAAAAAEAAEVRRMPSAQRVARIRPVPPTAGATLLRRSAQRLTLTLSRSCQGGEAVGIGGDVGGKQNKSYEELFPSEAKRQSEAKGRTSAWGSNFRAAPDVLHGYAAPLAQGARRTAEEKLDVRAATKADKFCACPALWISRPACVC